MAKREAMVKVSAKQVKEFKIPTLAAPLSLDQQFSSYLSDVKAAFLFLERFVDEDPLIASIIESYKKDKTKHTSLFSLDKLVESANIDPNSFARILISTIHYLCTTHGDIVISLAKAPLIEKSLAIAMDESLPESYMERKSWLEYMGLRHVNKNSQVININASSSQTTQNNTQLNVVNGLPSFASTIGEGEKIVNESLKQSISKSKQLSPKHEVIDIPYEKETEKQETKTTE